MSVILAVTMLGTTAMASDLDLTYHITNELDYDEDYVVTVPSGTVLTIVFEIENNDGEPLTLSSFQNEIYFDDEFFDYAQGEKTVFEGTSCGLKKYSSGEKRVFVNSVTDTELSEKKMVASFKLKVTETEVGAESIIETKSQLANGKNSSIAEKNLTVVIGETPPDTRKYDITYRDNDGSILYVDEDILNGQTTHLNSTVTKEGYVLDGWLIDNTPYEKGAEIVVDRDIDAYAKWVSETPVTYSVSFNSNGGSFVQAVSGVEGSTVRLNQTPTRNRYVFEGWYLDSDFSGQKVTKVTLTSDITVYAKWTREESGGGGGGGGAAPQATVTFKTTDGIELETIKRVIGSTIDLSKYTYEKEGYTFEGWYTDKELTNKITSIKLSEDTVIYANWTESKKEETEDKNKNSYKPGILTNEHYAYIVGREGGLIAPESDITRAEVATIIYRLLDEDERNKAKTAENVFTDVNECDWFNTAVSTLASLELVKGRTEDTFAPNACITRAELATIFARMVEIETDGKKLFSDVEGHWAESYINEAATAEWIIGYNGLFRPDDNITRAEVMTLVNRVLNREPETKEDLLSGMTTWVDNADETAWYYLAVQEATNSHTYKMKADGKHERWTKLTENPDWTKLDN